MDGPEPVASPFFEVFAETTYAAATCLPRFLSTETL